MSKIVIENTPFTFDEGCRLLKLKHEQSPFPELEEFWGEIKPMTFKEIAQMENLEKRRVGIVCLGLERLANEVKPTLVKSETVSKTTTYIDRNGKLVKESFEDTYELYEVKGESFGADRWGRAMENTYFVKFKDTSTDREYMIWVDARSVYETNRKDRYDYYQKIEQIDPIQCIAWTIQTTVEQGNIKEILRQGDCVLVKPKDSTLPLLPSPRHLTKKEYLTLLKAES
jgi:hypothetical protein